MNNTISCENNLPSSTTLTQSETILSFITACSENEIDKVKNLLTLDLDLQTIIQGITLASKKNFFVVLAFIFDWAHNNNIFVIIKNIFEIEPLMISYGFKQSWEYDDPELLDCLLPYLLESDIDETFVQACEDGKIMTIKYISQLNYAFDDRIFASGFNKACHWDRLEVVKYLVSIRPNLDINMGITQTEDVDIKNFLLSLKN